MISPDATSSSVRRSAIPPRRTWDATTAAIVAAGIAFAAQEIESVPKTPRDARLDLVLTEKETIDFRSM